MSQELTEALSRIASLQTVVKVQQNEIAERDEMLDFLEMKQIGNGRGDYLIKFYSPSTGCFREAVKQAMKP